MVVSFPLTIMHTGPVQQFLWLFPLVGEGVIVVTMLYRNLWRSLPIFFACMVVSIVRTIILFSDRNNALLYFYNYWLTEAAENIAYVCAIKELFDNIFHRNLGIRSVGDSLFRWASALLLIFAVVIAWNSPGGDIKKTMAAILVVKRTVSIIEAGLLIVLSLSVFLFGLPWGNPLLGIFLGFAVYGMVDSVAISIRAAYGSMDTGIFNWIMMVTYNCTVLTWAGYVLSTTPAKIAEAQLDPEDIERLSNEVQLTLSFFSKR